MDFFYASPSGFGHLVDLPKPHGLGYEISALRAWERLFDEMMKIARKAGIRGKTCGERLLVGTQVCHSPGAEQE